MNRYLMLLKFTAKGIAAIKDSPKRATAFRAAAKKAGVTLEAQYWTLGAYDGVIVLRAPDEATAVGLAMSLGKAGNVTTCTLPALDEKAFKAGLGKMPK